MKIAPGSPVYGLLAGLLLSACGGGGSDSPSASSAPAPAVSSPAPTAGLPATVEGLAMNCNDAATASSRGYRVENNTWGKGNLTGWSQCVGIGEGTGGSVVARFTWNWPNAGDNVKAYPEIIFGQKPGTPATTSALPRQISSLQELTVQYAATATHVGKGNTAFDIWLTSVANPTTFSVPPITHEIMIWLDSYGGMVPGGTFRETVQIGGSAYDVYVGDNFGSGWRYIAFIAKVARMGSASLGVRDFLAYAQSKGLITGAEYVASIEFGSEVISGTGELKIEQYSVSAR